MVGNQDYQMSGSEKKERRRGSNPAEGHLGFYVYCIAETITATQIAAQSLPAAIEDRAKLELVTSGQLTAIVSSVPLSIYGEGPLTERLTDATWTAVRAMRHEQVVEYFAKRASVVPLRFGTIYLERVRIERMLLEKRKELSEIIERLRDREEWGVNVHCDRVAWLAGITSVSPRLRDLMKRAEQATPGQSYLMQKKIETLRADEARAELIRVVDEIENTMRANSDEARRLRVLKVETTEYGELKAKFAFLVQRSIFENFRQSAENLARKNEELGIRLELTGPWPAYNFAAEDITDKQVEK
jgi:hypothetical protein